ncbi:MAG: ABC transporter permease [Kiritimatiellia bacterium]|jgi:iron(III) transport system permease protein
MLRNRTAWILFCLFTLLLGAMCLWPVFHVVAGGFRHEGSFTLRYMVGVFKNPIYAEGLRNSFFIALGTTLLSSCIAIPLAAISHRYTFIGRGVFSSLILVPMILPPFVGAIGLMQMLGPYGALNALLGIGPVDWLGLSRYACVVVLQSLAFYPILYLNVSAALANIDPAMEEAASNLGCHGWRTFYRITLPLIAPGLFAGGTLVFIASFTELGTPMMLNFNRCAAVQIYDELKEISSSPFPYALVTVVLAASVLLYVLARVFFGGRAHAMQTRATTAHVEKPLHGWRSLVAMLPFLLVTVFALLPHIGVVLTSFSSSGSWYRTVLPEQFTVAHYSAALSHGMTIAGIRNSLVFSALAVAVNIVLGVGIAWVTVRSRIVVRGALDALAMIPLAVPGLVMAFGFLSISQWFVNRDFLPEAIKPFLDVHVNPTLFLVIAYAVRRLPYMVRAASAGLQQTSVTLEEASANLGASPARTLGRITLPLICANLIAGVLLTFAFSMLEVSDSLILAQKMEYYPITKTIYELFQLIGVGRHLAAALGVWAMSFLAVTIVGSSLLLGKKLGALFRV